MVVSNFMEMLNRQSPNNYSSLSKIASEADAMEAFKNISVPIMMVVGSDDPNITVQTSSEFVLIKKCDINIVQGSGHNIPLENPKMLVKLIREFDERIKNSL